MKFNYQTYQSKPSDAFPSRKHIARPTLNIKLKYKDREINYLALVDSGADYNVFHAGIGEALGIDVKSGKKLPFFGTGGTEQIAYFHDVTLVVGGYDYKCKCGFSYNIEKLPYGLLGQNDFFAKFKVIFDYNKKRFELKRTST